MASLVVHLTDADTNDSIPLEMLLDELRVMKKQPVSRTYVPFGDGTRMYILATTNEKVDLAFGKLSNDGLRTLCRLFESRLEGNHEIVFSFDPAEGEVLTRSHFVTQTTDGDGNIIFHVSPGH